MGNTIGNLCQVMAMHDICGYGRSSLTVVIPILSTLECQVSPLPTALLSTHLGFSAPSMLVLDQQLEDILDHWKTLDLRFDCFYSGYLANPDQVDIALRYIDTFKPGFIFVDPVLGDQGHFYDGFDQLQTTAMLKLIARSHMISPNLTEACLLLGRTPETYLNEENAKQILRELRDLGPESVCITGIPSVDKKQIYSYGYSAKNAEFYRISSPYFDVNLHGTGDSFASVLVGLTLASIPFHQALGMAQGYLNRAVYLAVENNVELCIEPALKTLRSGSQSIEIEYLD
ncbi:MAG: pyridoxamine kinase [Spirochaetia bacterium]